MIIRTAIGLVSIFICLVLLFVSSSSARQPLRSPFADRLDALAEPGIKNPFLPEAALKNPFLPSDPKLKNPFTGPAGLPAATLKNPFEGWAAAKLLSPRKDPFPPQPSPSGPAPQPAIKDPFAPPTTSAPAVGGSAVDLLPEPVLKNPFAD